MYSPADLKDRLQCDASVVESVSEAVDKFLSMANGVLIPLKKRKGAASCEHGCV